MAPPEPAPGALCDLALAGSAVERGDLAEAERLLEAAGPSAAGDRIYRYVRARLFARRGEHDRALSELRAVPQEDVRPELLLWRARIEARLGQAQAARRSLARVRELPVRGDEGEVLFECAALYTALGLPADAERVVVEAMSRPPDGVTRRAEAIWLLLAARRFGAAASQIPPLLGAIGRRLSR